MMPACTGLPPGELIRRITPCVFLSLNALCSAPVTRSALASPLESITPTTSTSAVCLPELTSSSRGLMISSRNIVRYPNPRSLKKIPQRRARRCSRSDDAASFSRTSRSQLGSAIAVFLHKNLAVSLIDRDPDQPPLAGAAEAGARLGRVGRAVRRAYQNQPAGIEELPGLPVELHGQVRTSVQVGVHRAVVSDRERGLEASVDSDFEAHAVAGVDEIGARANHPFAFSHARSSFVSATQLSGRCSTSRSRGCAPWHTATAATPAFAAIWRSWMVSPIMSVRSAGTSSSSISSRSMSGAGLDGY